jgi:hypothetical protein
MPAERPRAATREHRAEKRGLGAAADFPAREPEARRPARPAAHRALHNIDLKSLRVFGKLSGTPHAIAKHFNALSGTPPAKARDA